MLEYLYTGNCMITAESVMEIWWAAKMYRMVALEGFCERMLQDCIDVDNCTALLERAETINSRLKMHILNFMIVNFDAINIQYPKLFEEEVDQTTKDYILKRRPAKMSTTEMEKFRQTFNLQKVDSKAV